MYVESELFQPVGYVVVILTKLTIAYGTAIYDIKLSHIAFVPITALTPISIRSYDTTEFVQLALASWNEVVFLYI